jgi:hypothetical protein
MSCNPSIVPDFSCGSNINTIFNRASSTTPLLITATTGAGAQTIGNLSLTISGVYDIAISSISVLQTSSNTITDMNLFVTVDGVQVGQTFTSSLSGVGHYLSMPHQSALLNASNGAHTILLKGYASTGSIITVNSFQLSAIGNLS